MKILAPAFILLSLLSACEQTAIGMGYPMSNEGFESNEGRGGSEAGERH